MNIHVTIYYFHQNIVDMNSSEEYYEKNIEKIKEKGSKNKRKSYRGHGCRFVTLNLFGDRFKLFFFFCFFSFLPLLPASSQKMPEVPDS